LQGLHHLLIGVLFINSQHLAAMIEELWIVGIDPSGYRFGH
jgi:hypothetical protein